MRTLGEKTYPLKWLTLPGDWPDILESEGAKRKVRSVKLVGLVQYPVVRKVDGEYRLIIGRQRVAALHLAGKKHVRCRVVECTDDEELAMQLVENAERIHSPGDQDNATKRLVDIFEQLHAAEPLPAKANVTARSEARQSVAAIRGVTKNSVLKAEGRVAKKAEGGGKPAIRTLDLELDPGWLASVMMAKVSIDEQLASLRRVKRALESMSDYPHQARVTAALSSVSGLLLALDGLRPEAACPYCSGKGGDCEGCDGYGFLTKLDASRVPKEQWPT